MYFFLHFFVSFTYICDLFHHRQPDHLLVDFDPKHHVGCPLDWFSVQVPERFRQNLAFQSTELIKLKYKAEKVGVRATWLRPPRPAQSRPG